MLPTDNLGTDLARRQVNVADVLRAGRGHPGEGAGRPVHLLVEGALDRDPIRRGRRDRTSPLVVLVVLLLPVVRLVVALVLAVVVSALVLALVSQDGRCLVAGHRYSDHPGREEGQDQQQAPCR